MREYNQKSTNVGSVSSTEYPGGIYVFHITHYEFVFLQYCKKSDKQQKLHTELNKDHLVFSGGNISG